MTSRTPRRHRRLAFMAAGTVAAMVLVPGTALAQDTTPSYDFEELVQVVEELTGSPASPAMPALPGTPALPELPASPLDSDDDSPGHETENPEFPDHGSGYVGNVDLNDTEIADIVRYDATVEDDGSTHSDSTVLALFGDEVVGSSSSSDGTTSTYENPTDGICEATSGGLCLSLLYHGTDALVDDDSSFAQAYGGVLAVCVLGDDPDVVTTYECDGLLGAGAAEGESAAERDTKTGHTEAYSDNELVKLCLTEGWDGFVCEGILGASVLHSDSDSESETPDTSRDSWLIGLDSGGEEILRIEDPTAVALLDCSEGGELALVCLFLNQGESFIYENPQGAGSAQEALHLDLVGNDPALILVELGRAESIAHLESPDDCPPGEKGPCPKKPECDDGIDNDDDGKIDFPADPGCKDKKDDSEKDDEGKKGDGGLAKTGADVAPLLAGAFLLIGMGALTVAVTRRRVGKHTI